SIPRTPWETVPSAPTMSWIWWAGSLPFWVRSPFLVVAAAVAATAGRGSAAIRSEVAATPPPRARARRRLIWSELLVRSGTSGLRLGVFWSGRAGGRGARRVRAPGAGAPVGGAVAGRWRG